MKRKHVHLVFVSVAVAGSASYASMPGGTSGPTRLAQVRGQDQTKQPGSSSTVYVDTGVIAPPSRPHPPEWKPSPRKRIDAEDGTDFFDAEMASSGCEPADSAAIYSDEVWIGLRDMLAYTDVVAVVKAGKVADRTTNKKVGPVGSDFTIEEVIWDRRRIPVPQSMVAGTYALPLDKPGKFSCRAPLPRNGHRYLAFLHEVDGQWWLASPVEGIYATNGKKLLRMNGGVKGPWIPLSIDEVRASLRDMVPPPDAVESMRGIPYAPPTTLLGEPPLSTIQAPSK